MRQGRLRLPQGGPGADQARHQRRQDREPGGEAPVPRRLAGPQHADDPGAPRQTGQPGGGGVLGDPAGDGIFVAGGAPGRRPGPGHRQPPAREQLLRAGAAGVDQPADRGGRLRRSGTTSPRRWRRRPIPRPFYRDAPWRMWDIHDDQGRPRAMSIRRASARPSRSTALDAVDACLGATLFFGDGEYSRAFGDRSADPTFGPFDPLRPDETLLPDGKLDAGDVPMPSALVEVPDRAEQRQARPISAASARWRHRHDRRADRLPVHRRLQVHSVHAGSQVHVADGAAPADDPERRTATLRPGAAQPLRAVLQPLAAGDERDRGLDLRPALHSCVRHRATTARRSGTTSRATAAPGLYDYWKFADVLACAEPARRAACSGSSAAAASGTRRSGPAAASSSSRTSTARPRRTSTRAPGSSSTASWGRTLNGGCELLRHHHARHRGHHRRRALPVPEGDGSGQAVEDDPRRSAAPFPKTVVCVPKAGRPPDRERTSRSSAPRPRSTSTARRSRARRCASRPAGRQPRRCRVPDRDGVTHEGGIRLRPHQRQRPGVGRGVRQVREAAT